jgi:hypothetical protein
MGQGGAKQKERQEQEDEPDQVFLDKFHGITTLKLSSGSR